jgi:F-box and WD-40 domain protein CDC4
MKLCEKHDYDRRTSFSHAIPSFRPPPQPHTYFDGAHASAPPLLPVGPSLPPVMGSSRSFDSSTTTRRPKIRSYKSHFKQRYLVETAWRTGGQNVARHITQDQGVVTSLHLTPKYIVVALDNAKIHVFNTDGNNQKTLQGHVMGVWAMVPWDDVLVSGGCDRDVRVWNMATGYVLDTQLREV